MQFENAKNKINLKKKSKDVHDKQNQKQC